VGSSE
jgi:hypothetical protein